MAGEARSIDFLVGTATIMLGLPADLRDFRPETHSIGLVKNVKLMAEATYIELTQGLRNSVVHSVKTGEPVRASAEVYEFNASNWSYALGFSGYNVGIPTTSVGSAVIVAVEALTPANGLLAPANTSGYVNFTLTNTTNFVVGDYVLVQMGINDVVVPRRIVANASGAPASSLTFDAPIKNIDIGNGVTVTKCLIVPVGRKSEQPFLAAKIVGNMADGREIAIEIPKLRITKGFDVTFQTSDYTNMPFEFTVYDQIPADNQYARFQEQFDGASAVIYTNH
jgi:hypothetical protein